MDPKSVPIQNETVKFLDVTNQQEIHQIYSPKGVNTIELPAPLYSSLWMIKNYWPAEVKIRITYKNESGVTKVAGIVVGTNNQDIFGPLGKAVTLEIENGAEVTVQAVQKSVRNVRE